MSNTLLIKRFLPYYKKYKWILLLDLFCATLTTVCDLVLPLIVRFITNTAINSFASLTVEIILKLGFIYLLLRIIDGIANYFMADIGHVMGAQIETDMRRDLFGHLQKLSFSFYSDTKIGQLMSRITTDLFDVTEFAHHCPEEFFIAGLKIGVSFIILANINIWLTLIIFAALPVMIFTTTYFRRRMRTAFKRSRVQTGEINAQVEDNLLGIRVVKSFANENIEEIKFAEGNRKFLEIKKLTYRYMAGFQTTTRLFDGLMYLLVVVFGGIFMINGTIDPGDYIAYLMYVTTLLTSIRRIVEFAEQFQRGMTGFERFIEILDEPTEYENQTNEVELTNVVGDISFEDVSFQYNDGEDEVLSHIDITVKAGENIAIVGPSGSGKTTLCHLIPRFYNVTSGRILIDHQDIQTLTLHSLRSQVGVVQQDVYLFSGTVYENIIYGKEDANRESVIQAAKHAGAHEFIEKLPNGYDTHIGERGIKLSGGQKQRISIARVFLKNPPILILDEATSALDNESERIVQNSLKKLTQGRTTFTIAHRLTTIKNADSIIVLTEDGIVEKGSHAKLISEEGVYYDLYQMYQELDELNEVF
ncbi:ABC transporter ATP-binding protein [Acetobacterium woodii]|uniref:Multidrug ABC transport system ATP-binding and permease protein n=1 Tax=Acetobacterium woodii (strain ATCC 29683 / DSM 1030 / JCM 2381 / KCTC 1655 / WB1) TaxID=931626 RepID=H6LFW7_ACEWD|nr:ABC transporter ATP-binding protein [Acetobacterium woodii]AFA48255.1 multidrug ABC transport system ATP-binding and permease protein [Acetobacterium woodii DSM 1030]